MTWILEHLQLVVIVASAFAWWLSQRRQKQEEEQRPEEPVRPEVTTHDELERTRRIQEDIRRKIAQRRAGPMTAPAPVPDRPVTHAEPPPIIVVDAPRRVTPDWSEIDQARLEEQRRLQDKLRELEAQRRAANQAATAAAFGTSQLPSETVRGTKSVRGSGDRALVAALRDKRSLRQAFVLREVLGPPVGLR